MRQFLTLGFSALAASPALAADGPFGPEATEALINGNTLYVEIPAGTPGAPEGGTAPIYYGTDGAAAAQLPGGPKLVGVWSMTANGYCIHWENGPKNSCSVLQRGDAMFLIVDAASGDPRGTVTRIATGNPENL
ncbi:MAG: hypothetical protein ACU0GG_03045 [Paracoccaceae bacterium]